MVSLRIPIAIVVLCSFAAFSYSSGRQKHNNASLLSVINPQKSPPLSPLLQKRRNSRSKISLASAATVSLNTHETKDNHPLQINVQGLRSPFDPHQHALERAPLLTAYELLRTLNPTPLVLNYPCS